MEISSNSRARDGDGRVVGGDGSPFRAASHNTDFEDLFANATVALHIVGPEGRILHANSAELKLLGYRDLGWTFYACGPARATNRLAELLEAAKARGEIHADDCVCVADHFVGLIRDNLHLQVVLGLRPPPDEKETHEVVLSAVDVFLTGVKSR